MAHINYKLIGKKRRKKKSHSLSRFSPCGSINLRFPSLSRVPLWSQKSSRHEITAAIRERRNFGENLKIPKKKKKKKRNLVSQTRKESSRSLDSFQFSILGIIYAPQVVYLSSWFTIIKEKVQVSTLDV